MFGNDLVGRESVGNELVVGVDDIEGKVVMLGSIVAVGTWLVVGVDVIEGKAELVGNSVNVGITDAVG